MDPTRNLAKRVQFTQVSFLTRLPFFEFSGVIWLKNSFLIFDIYNLFGSYWFFKGVFTALWPPFFLQILLYLVNVIILSLNLDLFLRNLSTRDTDKLLFWFKSGMEVVPAAVVGSWLNSPFWVALENLIAVRTYAVIALLSLVNRSWL